MNIVWTVGDVASVVGVGLVVLGWLVLTAIDWWNEYYGGRK